MKITELEEYIEETDLEYQHTLKGLQIELLFLQKHIVDSGQRLLILFEGRDAAGKGGAISRFSQFLNPRHLKVVALDKPTPVEASQWYFQRFIQHLPSAGKMVFFDRSWYNRAVVEPALGFCTEQEYLLFMKQVVQFEEMLVEDGLKLYKFWFSIDEIEQKKRLKERQVNPLKQWKLSPTDLLAHENFDVFSCYRKKMFASTSTKAAPWQRILGNDKKTARLESIRFLLSQIDYPDKGQSGSNLEYDSSIITPQNHETT